MRRWLAELLRRPFRSLVPVALATLAPKCGVCVLAYAGVGELLGLRFPEICGASAASRGPGGSTLAAFGVAAGIVGLLAALRCRRNPIRNEDCSVTAR